ALTADTQVLAWGDNAFGQLGDGTTIARSAPVAVPISPSDFPTGTDTHVMALAAGASHTIAATASGLFVWGDNSSGQLGDGTFTSRLTPELLPAPSNGRIVDVVAGDGFSVASVLPVIRNFSVLVSPNPAAVGGTATVNVYADDS